MTSARPTHHPYRDDLERLAIARSLRLVHPARLTKVIARTLLAAFAMLVVGFGFVPWQQSSTGTGRVIAYAPVERQQTIEATVEGRILRWHVREGDHVDMGDPICDLSDNDPDILVRLGQERDAQLARIAASKARRESIESRIASLGFSRTASVAAAEQRVRMARERASGQERAKEAAAQAHRTAELNAERQKALFDGGLTSKRAVELADLELVRTRTEVDRADAALRAAANEVLALSADLTKVGSDLTASIDESGAARAMVDAEIASANAELARIDVRLSRQGAQSLKAPRAGMILRVIGRQGGDMVKAGDVLAVMVPDTSERAVELWLDGNDIPLVTPGRKVRVQFEGWPAVQFAGWPEMAIGTFGGVVAFVDAAAAEDSGKFRVLVVPDEPWPAPAYLRQGTRVNGWVFLNRVRLGYEVWRQLNGFPAVVPTKDMLDPGPGARGATPKK